MAKVKFDANLSDYDVRNNMKVLQSVLNRHRITKQVETEKLIKCRLLDNLELLQWLKKHWMEHKDINIPYDALLRRKGSPAVENSSRTSSRRSTMTSASTPHASANVAPLTRGLSRRSSTSSFNNAGLIQVQKRRVASSSLPSVNSTAAVRGSPHPDLLRLLSEATEELEGTRAELRDYKIMAESLETERNFYFNKLREIEILMTNIEMLHDGNTSVSAELKDLLLHDMMGHIKEILYSAEKGFEVQNGSDPDLAGDAESF